MQFADLTTLLDRIEAVSLGESSSSELTKTGQLSDSVLSVLSDGLFELRKGIRNSSARLRRHPIMFVRRRLMQSYFQHKSMSRVNSLNSLIDMVSQTMNLELFIECKTGLNQRIVTALLGSRNGQSQFGVSLKFVDTMKEENNEDSSIIMTEQRAGLTDSSTVFEISLDGLWNCVECSVSTHCYYESKDYKWQDESLLHRSVNGAWFDDFLMSIFCLNSFDRCCNVKQSPSSSASSASDLRLSLSSHSKNEKWLDTLSTSLMKCLNDKFDDGSDVIIMTVEQRRTMCGFDIRVVSEHKEKKNNTSVLILKLLGIYPDLFDDSQCYACFAISDCDDYYGLPIDNLFAQSIPGFMIINDDHSTSMDLGCRPMNVGSLMDCILHGSNPKLRSIVSESSLMMNDNNNDHINDEDIVMTDTEESSSHLDEFISLDCVKIPIMNDDNNNHDLNASIQSLSLLIHRMSMIQIISKSMHSILSSVFKESLKYDDLIMINHKWISIEGIILNKMSEEEKHQYYLSTVQLSICIPPKLMIIQFHISLENAQCEINQVQCKTDEIWQSEMLSFFQSHFAKKSMDLSVLSQIAIQAASLHIS